MARPLADWDPDSRGGRCRDARLKLGLDQKQAGERVGCSGAFISDVERGRRNVTLDWLRDYADALGVPRSSLSPDLADRPAGPPRKKGR